MTQDIDRRTIRKDILRLLQDDGRFRPRDLANRLGYTDDRAYGRFRDVLDELEERRVVAYEDRHYFQEDAAQKEGHAPAARKKTNGHAAAPKAKKTKAKPKAKPKAKAKAPTGRQTRLPKRTELAEHEQPRDPNKAVGRLIVKPQGFGFVEVEEQEDDYFIREHSMGTALDGDLVLVGLGAMQKNHVNKRRECEVLEVVERRRTQVVGTFSKKGHFAFVQPDDQRVIQDIYVAEEDFGAAEDGEKVVVSIDRFESRKASPEGRILRVLGPATDPATRVLSLAMSMDVKADFPDEVEREAERIPEIIPQKEIQRRLDLRAEDIFTIDPADAKDFDDAIHIKEKPNGNYEVGVHIADVSHYVRSNTALDQEALERGTSVYLVDRTIPMLPEKLSNLVCSLRPREDKCAFSCIMEISRHGDFVGYELRESVIHSKERFTYEKAQDLVDGGFPDHPLASDVVAAARLARTLTKRRMREGSVDFDMKELKVILDEEGHPVDIVRKERKEANRLIEEFMLLANQAVAWHIGQPAGKKKSDAPPFPYRIHAEPDAERIQQLAEYVRIFGYELPLTDGNVKSTELNELLSDVQGTPEEAVIVRSALRAMSKAIYSTENIGHYGLGFDAYSHFTSPIRRYPDLIAHRLLKHYAEGGKPVDERELSARLKHCSERERAAVEAERESVKLKQVEYVQAHVGETFDGVATGVTKFGVFVELSALLVEGLVHVRDMDDDYYEYDESTFTMRGERTGKTYRPGDAVEVKVTGANVEKREIDLLFV